MLKKCEYMWERQIGKTAKMRMAGETRFCNGRACKAAEEARELTGMLQCFVRFGANTVNYLNVVIAHPLEGCAWQSARFAAMAN